MTSPLRVPSRRFYGEVMSSSLLHLQLQKAQSDPDLDRQGWTARRVMGFKVPAWQRPEVWTTEQCAHFVESVWLGASIGTYMVNQHPYRDDVHNVLLDGQQRLRAVERYWNDEFPITGEDGLPHLWSELAEDGEKARFHRIAFPWILTRYETEALMREAYDRHNFCGTPHGADQRAATSAA